MDRLINNNTQCALRFSCFLFFFALSGIVWKLKHEYDLYVRRQRQYIEQEQMASRPFSTILLEMFRPPEVAATAAQKANKLAGEQRTTAGTPPSKGPALADEMQQQATSGPIEPTPISFEPCFGSNVGVLSLFVQLPGRPNLAIGSALVSLNEEANSATTNATSACEQAEESNEQAAKRNQPDKAHISVKNP